MNDAIYILYAIGGWLACSLIMMFFLPLLQEKLDLSDEQSYQVVAFGPLALPIGLIIALFWFVNRLGKKLLT